MPLTKCMKCGGVMSDRARKCPHCGFINISKTEISPISQSADVKGTSASGTNDIMIPQKPQARPMSQAPQTSQVPQAPQAPQKPQTVQVTPTAPMPQAPQISAIPEEKPKKKRGWVWAVIVTLVLLLLGGGGFGYWYYQTVYLPEKIDREAPRTYPIVNVQLRSSKMAGGEFNKLTTVPFGSELITYDNDGEWSKVKYIVPGTEDKYEGYAASPYLVDKKDFYIVNSILADNDVREVIATSKVRKALLDYFKSKGYFGDLASELQAEVGLSPNSENQWQIIFHHGQAKPNEVLFSRMVNADSKFTDMAVLIENINTHDRKLLYFYFDDDETPHLLFDGDAPGEGNIVSVKDGGTYYRVSFTDEDKYYMK